MKSVFLASVLEMYKELEISDNNNNIGPDGAAALARLEKLQCLPSARYGNSVSVSEQKKRICNKGCPIQESIFFVNHSLFLHFFLVIRARLDCLALPTNKPTAV